MLVRTHGLHSCKASRPNGVRTRSSRSICVRPAAAAATDKAQPDWTGDQLLSRIVNWMIRTPPIFGAMKFFAKQAMVSTAEKAGIDWTAHVQRMQQEAELEQLRREFDTGVTYPSYYLQPFHAYDQGNLNWLAAYEVEPASYAMALRTFKTEDLSPEVAMTRLRASINEQITTYLSRHGIAAPFTLLDIGCSTGISTTWLQRAFPAAAITGMDLSPYFLAVAEYQRRRQQQDAATPSSSSSSSSSGSIKYMQGLGEATGFPDASWDLVAYNFVIHECPQQAIRDFVTESRRILKLGGVLCFVDNNPRSKTIQNLPPALFTLMKSTEPWSDEYYSFDLEAAMREAGFKEVITTEADHRHRVVLGIKA